MARRARRVALRHRVADVLAGDCGEKGDGGVSETAEDEKRRRPVTVIAFTATGYTLCMGESLVVAHTNGSMMHMVIALLSGVGLFICLLWFADTIEHNAKLRP